MDENQKKPLNHPDYVIGRGEDGSVMISYSQWSRENVPKEPPRFKVGDLVLVALYVTKSYEDCDGTPLFAVGSKHATESWRMLYGYGNDSLEPAPPEEDEIQE